MRLVLLGPPGAGKGSLASLLKTDLGFLHISTGDILREEMKNGTSLGLEAKRFVDNGDLVSDDLVIRLIENKIKQESENVSGFMLDGFPRTLAQAEQLDKFLENNQIPLEMAFYMEVNIDLIIVRLTGRRVCRECNAVYHMTNHPPKVDGVCDKCDGTDVYQRADDNEETIRNRMNVYLKNTLPIVDYYDRKGILKRVDGGQDSKDLQKILVKMLNEDS